MHGDNCYPDLKCNPGTNDLDDSCEFSTVVPFLKPGKFKCLYPNHTVDCNQHCVSI